MGGEKFDQIWRLGITNQDSLQRRQQEPRSRLRGKKMLNERELIKFSPEERLHQGGALESCRINHLIKI